MKYKQAYIKLASLRLAINYVLRNRSMTKSASEWTNPLIGAGVGMGLGYLLSPEKHKLLGTLGGGLVGGVAGYGFNQLNKSKETDSSFSDSDREAEGNTVTSSDQYITTPQANGIIYGGVKPEFGYILNLADALENNVNTVHEGDIHVSSSPPNQISYLRDLAVRASLEPGKPGYISPERLQSELLPYYNAYNGVEQNKKGDERVLPISKLTFSSGGHIPAGKVINVPVYPLEGVINDDPEMKAFSIADRHTDRRWTIIGTEDGKTVYHNEEPFSIEKED